MNILPSSLKVRTENCKTKKTFFDYENSFMSTTGVLQTYIEYIQGRKCGGVWGGGSPPQRNDPVGLKLSAVGLKIMRLFIHVVLCEAN